MYRKSGQQHDKLILWGAPASLWSGRVRAYLIKKGIDYQEIYPAHPRYQSDILPQIGYWVVPVTEFEDGTLIQDGTDTMERLEARYPQRPMIPSTPVQRGVAWLIELFGCDLFFIPAMHYRWNFPEQRTHIDAEFARAVSRSRDAAGQRADIAPLQAAFAGFPALMGINPATIPAIEQSHVECLALLNHHFQYHPYVLGGHPSIADFGLIGPLYAHLGRDPVPANLMKNSAPHLYRWTERMFEAGLVDGEFYDTPVAFPDDDDIPETLVPFIQYLFRDCGPQLQGMLDTFNAWADSSASLAAGTPVKASADSTGGAHPHLGAFEFDLRGTSITSQAFANVVYHFQRVQDVIAALDTAGRDAFDNLMDRTGGSAVMATPLTRRLQAKNYQLLLA